MEINIPQEKPENMSEELWQDFQKGLENIKHDRPLDFSDFGFKFVWDDKKQCYHKVMVN